MEHAGVEVHGIMHGMMRAFRQVLVARGFEFCDEGPPEHPHFPPNAPGPDGGLAPLLQEGVDASSTDNQNQGIERTLEDDADTFWSSAGSQSADATEYLLFKLRSPLCLVRSVHLTVYRARYQFGEPLYPPRHVSFQAGASPWNMAAAAGKYPVAATDAEQVFPLPADLPVGRYLRINLHGKRQKQLEDLQWYHAIQRVEAFGQALTPSQAVTLRHWAAKQLRPLPPPGVVPAYLVAEALALHPAPPLPGSDEASGQQQQRHCEQGQHQHGQHPANEGAAQQARQEQRRGGFGLERAVSSASSSSFSG